MFVKIKNLIRFIILFLAIGGLFVVVAPGDLILKIPFGPEFKVFIENLWGNVSKFFTEFFKNFGDWIDNNIGNLISDIFDKAEQTTQDAVKDKLPGGN
ncbi:MAG: hypothetical protein A3H51_00605 [Candidatus Spechtbacteria bacterium RIFCSPLOWO2_02_FULL_38_8]|uniref:Uncharacterized protein n=1 Tax=Candidatus Spechtbacteria bacterium RIFCSPLOWO2_02_FULL_38_8 TaxID=1802164 RepID=A0A1G2HKE9_9BACT|nr:MAG: hypothetical protein A3H51_00605 [Candidatus Spechtbacteria bacterium RIFCSPLOWO2_02_FULL_38_8]